MKPILIFCLLLLLLATSCTHRGSSNTISGDYMIIGSAGGFTSRASTYYRISGGQLWADTVVLSYHVPTNISDFHFNTLLPASKYATVKNLLSQVPAELLSRNKQDIGNYIPDMGYTDVRTSVNGASYQWTFEGDQSGSSTAIQQFLDSVRVVFQ